MALLNIILMLLTFAFLRHQIAITEARLDFGVCYGMMGNNLPPPEAVVQLYRRHNISKMRLLDTNSSVLAALRGSGIEVTVGVGNRDLESIASSVDAAKTWFDTNVQPYMSGVKITHVTAGSEAVPGDLGRFVLPAMRNLQSVVNEYGHSGMRITTVVPNTTLVTFNPPSRATFSDATRADMVGIINFLSSNGSPLMIKAYPFYAYDVYPRANVSMEYYLGNATDAPVQEGVPSPVVKDGSLTYYSMLDAIVDGFYWAMEKEGVTGVDVVVSETGWPSDGDPYVTEPELAQTYNKNVLKKFLAKTGTPKRPDRRLGGFFYSMFNENLKLSEFDRYFGLFHTSGEPVYRLLD